MKLKGIIIVVAVVLLSAGFATNGYAQTKLGYLDLSKIFDEYGKTKEYDEVLEAKYTGYEKERDQKIEELRAQQEKLSLLKEEEKAKVEQELEKKRNEFLEYDRQKKTDLTKQRDEKIREILLEIEGIVKNFAEKEKYTMILNDRVLIYGNPATDITDQILKILNDGYNKK